MGRDDHLFFQAASFAVQEHQRKEMKPAIAGMDGNRLLNTNVDDLVSKFAEATPVAVERIRAKRSAEDVMGRVGTAIRPQVTEV